MESDEVLREWRTGRDDIIESKRAIYVQVNGEEASDDDHLIGLMDSYSVAKETIEAHNKVLKGRYS